jgi:hypothetical protein
MRSCTQEVRRIVMPGWEYMTAKVDVVTFRGWIAKEVSVPGVKSGKLEDFLAEAGRQGWELAGSNFSYSPFLLIFKRLKQ